MLAQNTSLMTTWATRHPGLGLTPMGRRRSPMFSGNTRRLTTKTGRTFGFGKAVARDTALGPL